MKEKQELTPESVVMKPDQLMNLLFSKLKDFGTSVESSRLFPNGLDSVKLEVTNDDGNQQKFRLDIKAAALQKLQPGDVLKDLDEDDFEVSFNAEGHRVIVRIAMMDLQTNSPDIMQKVQKVLDDGDRTFLEAAIFPDVIRNEQPETKPFHFVDIIFKDGGPADPPLPSPPHVLSKIPEYSDFLTNGNHSAKEMVDALSWLFHLYGDVHQPLHCIERVSDFHPQGDRGGNLFKLTGKAKNLHAAWDSSVNVLSPGKDEEVLALEIMEEHTREDLSDDLAVRDIEKWARSSYRLAKKNAYSLKENPSNPPKPSTAYLKNMETIGRRQAALGGYRLANKLREIFE